VIRLRLLPPLTRVLGEREILVDLDRGPLRLVLERALAQNERVRSALVDQAGGFSHEYSCLVNGQRYNVSDLGDLEVGESDEILLLLPLAGGGIRPVVTGRAVAVAICPIIAPTQRRFPCRPHG